MSKTRDSLNSLICIFSEATGKEKTVLSLRDTGIKEVTTVKHLNSSV